MKVNGHTLTVLKQDGSPFPEVVGEGGHFVVAEPGQVFKVSVHFSHTPGLYAATLTVGGKQVGYRKVGCRPGSTELFEGFLEGQAMPGVPSTLREYRFAQPVEALAGQDVTVAQLEACEVSQLEVKVYTTRCVGERQHDWSSYQAPAAAGSVPKRADGKKAFLAPSLAIQAGNALQKDMGWSSKDYKDDKVPVAVLRVRCETVSQLVLRRVLSHTKPAHLEIMAASLPPEQPDATPTPAPANRASSSHAARPAHVQPGAQRPAATVKRERGSGSSTPAVDAGAVVDLTAPAQLPRENLDCDLRSEAPRWAKRPKTPAVSLLTSTPRCT